MTATMTTLEQHLSEQDYLEVDALISDMLDYLYAESLEYVYFAEADIFIELCATETSIIAQFNQSLFFNRQSLVNAVVDFIS